MKNLKKLYGSKRKAKEAAYAIRKLNQWIKWANKNKGWNGIVYREVSHGIN